MSSPNIMHQWFKHLFEQRMDTNHYVKCFECGGLMHENTYKELSICYSHILAKSEYVEHVGNPENIEIVHPDCHNLYTMRPKKAIKQYAKFLQLKNKYYE